ncbi:hypothetical protein J3F84DRAFT_140079 [Trichoderma pleuroticola]
MYLFSALYRAWPVTLLLPITLCQLSLCASPTPHHSLFEMDKAIIECEVRSVKRTRTNLSSEAGFAVIRHTSSAPHS